MDSSKQVRMVQYGCWGAPSFVASRSHARKPARTLAARFLPVAQSVRFDHPTPLLPPFTFVATLEVDQCASRELCGRGDGVGGARKGELFLYLPPFPGNLFNLVYLPLFTNAKDHQERFRREEIMTKELPFPRRPRRSRSSRR